MAEGQKAASAESGSRPTEEATSRRLHWLPVLGVAAIKVVLSMAVSARYGWHRDELYYLASAHHLELGYVDFPPVTPLVARLVQVVAPDSVVALRFSSILAGAVVAVLAALIARDLGGRGVAQVLAALAVVISPVYLLGDFIFGTDAFDQLLWAILLWIVVRILAGGDRRLWIVAGVALGVGLETKYTIFALAIGLAAGLLLTHARRDLAAPWPWIGIALAVVLFLPNLWWQVGHGWISIVYTLQHRGNTDGPVAYWLEQVVTVQPVLLPLAVAGGVWLWRSGRFRAMAWTAVLVEVLFFCSSGKSYYPAAVYPLLYAAGMVWLERSVGSRLVRSILIAAATAVTLVLLPIELPVLSAASFARSGLWREQPDFAEMYGWPSMVHQVDAAYTSLPARQRGGAMILASNYGEAGALDLYGDHLRLPPVVSPHLTYYYWAPARMDPQVVIAVGYQRQDLGPLFASVTRVGTIRNAYGIENDEEGNPIFVCRSPRRPLWQVWPSLLDLN